RDSEFFKRVLSGRPNASDGTYYVPGLKVYQFESLLDFFYDGMYFISPIATPIEYWVNLLSVSTNFEFPRAREHAIAAIDICQSLGTSDSNTIDPARIIEIANLYGVEKWLEPAYAALAEREEMVSAEEAEMIGMKGVLVIMREREARLRETIRGMERKNENEAFRCSDLEARELDDHDGEGTVLRGSMNPASSVPSSTFIDLATPSPVPSLAPSRAPSVVPSLAPSRAPSPRAPSPPPWTRIFNTPLRGAGAPSEDEIFVGHGSFHSPTLREGDNLEVPHIPEEPETGSDDCAVAASDDCAVAITDDCAVAVADDSPIGEPVVAKKEPGIGKKSKFKGKKNMNKRVLPKVEAPASPQPPLPPPPCPPSVGYTPFSFGPSRG
ncbi:hypothetical protein V5O48_015964, partial [Marasmius crinis-equi]